MSQKILTDAVIRSCLIKQGPPYVSDMIITDRDRQRERNLQRSSREPDATRVIQSFGKCHYSHTSISIHIMKVYSFHEDGNGNCLRAIRSAVMKSGLMSKILR